MNRSRVHVSLDSAAIAALTQVQDDLGLDRSAAVREALLGYLRSPEFGQTRSLATGTSTPSTSRPPASPVPSAPSHSKTLQDFRGTGRPFAAVVTVGMVDHGLSEADRDRVHRETCEAFRDYTERRPTAGEAKAKSLEVMKRLGIKAQETPPDLPSEWKPDIGFVSETRERSH